MDWRERATAEIERRGLSKAEVARRIGWKDENQLYKMLSATNPVPPDPGIGQIARLADAVGCDLWVFFKGDEEQPPLYAVAEPDPDSDISPAARRAVMKIHRFLVTLNLQRDFDAMAISVLEATGQVEADAQAFQAAFGAGYNETLTAWGEALARSES